MKHFLYLTIAAFLSMTALVACDNDDSNGPEKTPPSVEFINALKARFPKADKVEWEREGPNHVAEFIDNGHKVEVWFDINANWIMTEVDLGKSLLSVPTPVATAFASGEYSTWKIDEIYYYQRLDSEFYLIEIENPGQPDHELYYTPDGILFKDITEISHTLTPEV